MSSEENKKPVAADESPYISQCTRCGNGLLRIYQCDLCETVAAMCDECELIWSDIAEVAKDPEIESSGMFPECPSCEQVADWTRLESDDATEAGLDEYIAGTSP